jgi:hypothetical protein
MQEFLLPISMAMGFVVYGLAARWYLVPWMKDRSLADGLTPLLLLHGTRFVGLAFLIPGVTNVPLDPRFAEPAAWGDLLAAVLAIIALLALRKGRPGSIALVWIFNIVGTIDLLNAVTQGLRFTTNGDMGATYFIPAVIVPLLLVTHWVIFWRLLYKPRAG